MATKLSTQAQIEELLSNPSMFDSYIQARAIEKWTDMDKTGKIKRNIFPDESTNDQE